MNIQAKSNSDGSVDLIGKQGSTWRLTLELKQSDNTPMDLTGYFARSHIKKDYSDVTPVAQFTCVILNPPTGGKISLYMDANTTASIPCGRSPKDPASVYVYDVEIESANGEVSRILEGRLFIDPEVTK